MLRFDHTYDLHVAAMPSHNIHMRMYTINNSLVRLYDYIIYLGLLSGLNINKNHSNKFSKINFSAKFPRDLSQFSLIDVEISQFYCYAKIAIKFHDFDRFFPVFRLTTILRKIFYAKVLPRTWPFRKGANHDILSITKGWKHFPKIILNESKVAAVIENFCAENGICARYVAWKHVSW